MRVMEHGGIGPRLPLNVEDAADLLRTSRSTIYTLMRSGDLASIRMGKSRRIRRADLESFVRTPSDAPSKEISS